MTTNSRDTSNSGIVSYWPGHGTQRENLRRGIAEFAADGASGADTLRAAGIEVDETAGVETLVLVCSDE